MSVPGLMDLDEDQVPGPAEVTIGGYRIQGTLGTGTFGKVKRAQHILTGVTVAVKILNRGKVRALKMDNKIKREIQILQLFRHPHIIRMYEVIETSSDVFMFLEFVSGGELFDLIVQRGKLDEPEARRYFQQVISGVDYCHIHRVVHRDLKPENLLLDGSGNVKIADFGLSNIMEDGAFLQTSCGSPNYAAPEVISGQMYSGQEIDVWSCGVILYALVVGKLPFDEDYIPTLFQKIRGGVYHVPSFVSGPCSNLIARLLDVNPISRITVPEVRGHVWFAVDLPEYLAEASVRRKTTIRVQNVNDAIVRMLLQRCGNSVTEEFVRQKLQSDQTNDIIVAYNLLLDAHPHLRVSVSAGNLAATLHSVESTEALDAIKTFATSPAMNLRDEGSLIPTPARSFTMALSVPQLGRGDDPDDVDDGPEELAGGPRSLGARGPGAPASPSPVGPRSCWYLGVLTEKEPEAIMAEVYRVLRLCFFEWKTVTKFHLRVRPLRGRRTRAMSMSKKRRSVFGSRERTPDGHEEGLGNNDNVKLELAVYRVNTTQCLVDFKRLSDEGTTQGFIMTCNLLISVLGL